MKAWRAKFSDAAENIAVEVKQMRPDVLEKLDKP